MPTIYWAPNSGFEYGVSINGQEITQRQSATTCLIDEADHTIRYLQNKKRSYLDATPGSDQIYQSRSERYSIEAAYSLST